MLAALYAQSDGPDLAYSMVEAGMTSRGNNPTYVSTRFDLLSAPGRDQDNIAKGNDLMRATPN
ncbi:MAG: hypothetical protein ACO3DQ_00595 [Cephaloticoccus sp.]